MSATAAQIGKGSSLGYATVGATNFASLGELRDVNPPEVSVAKVDATRYDSPDSTMEYLSAVWQENGDVEGELNYLKAQTTTLVGLVGASNDFKITLPDSSTFVFTGFLSKLGTSVPNKDVITQKISITPKSKVTFTAGT